MAAEFSYIGLGTLYAAESTTPDELYPLGNCSAAVFAVSEDKKTLKNYQKGGGLANSRSRIDSVILSVTMLDHLARNIAMVVFGEDSAVVSGSVTGEGHTAYDDALIPFAHINPSNVVITGRTEGTDYEVTGAGIHVIEGSGFTGAFTVSYDYSDYNVIEAFVNSGKEYRLIFDGLNDAQSGAPNVVETFRVKPGPTQGLGLISDDYSDLPIEFEVLRDSTKVGAGISQFFKARQVGG